MRFCVPALALAATLTAFAVPAVASPAPAPAPQALEVSSDPAAHLPTLEAHAAADTTTTSPAPGLRGPWKTHWRRTKIAQTTTPALTTAPTTTAAPSSPSFGFLAKGADGSAARWNACATVRWAFNPANAPAGALPVIQSAFDEISATSGLKFEYVGTTTTAVSFEYLSQQPYQTPGPVVIGWTPKGHSIFANQPSSVVGMARVRYVQARDANGSESFRIFAGVVALDSADAAPLTGSRSWRTYALHEIGHLAGLGHPTDSTQIMHSVIPDRTSLNAGDKRGLGYVGTPVPCMSKAY